MMEENCTSLKLVVMHGYLDMDFFWHIYAWKGAERTIRSKQDFSQCSPKWHCFLSCVLALGIIPHLVIGFLRNTRKNWKVHRLLSSELPQTPACIIFPMGTSTQPNQETGLSCLLTHTRRSLVGRPQASKRDVVFLIREVPWEWA